MSSKPIKIKEVIETLCLLFSCHGYPKLSAEKAVLPLVDLLFSLLTKNLKQDFSKWFPQKRLFVILDVLKKLCYPRLSILFCNELHGISSQELLLSFGFLVSKLDIIGRLRFCAENMHINWITNSSKQKCKFSGSERTIDLDHSIRLIKRVEFLSRDLQSSCSYLEKLLRKFDSIDKSEIGNGLSSLDEPKSVSQMVKVEVVDLIFFENFRLQEDCLDLLRKQVELLRLHVKWTQNETLFWKWLASINSKDTPMTTHHTKPPHSPRGPWSNCLRDHVSCVIKKLLSKHDFNLNEQSAQIKFDNKQRYECELNEIQKRIKLLEEENKLWLSNFLHEHFPDVVQMSELKTHCPKPAKPE